MKECFKQTTRTEVTSMLKNAMERDFIQELFPTLLKNSSNCESPCCLQVQPPLTVTGTNKQTLSRVGENLM